MVIVFDLIGTLLNTHALESSVRQATHGKVGASEFSAEVTTYAMASTLAGVFRPYEVIASSVLQMNAAAHGEEINEKELTKFKKRLYSLPPFPDVKGALKQLHARGLRLAVLSNGSANMLEAALDNAGLDKFFDHVISVETVEKYKPAQEVYNGALERLGGGPHELLMVAAHPWDLLGAAAAGYRTALIQRAGKAPYPAAPPLNHVAADIQEFTNQLLGTETERGGSSRGWLIAGCGLALGLAGSVAVGASARANRVALEPELQTRY